MENIIVLGLISLVILVAALYGYHTSDHPDEEI